ncbi:YncE family protein [Streptomyces sp. NPDC012888]|uniref:YncE family protein n=1 Tax=Streptomyces sp. NPDC012888 TaxID=3364855 RepID=UPI00368E9024
MNTPHAEQLSVVATIAVGAQPVGVAVDVHGRVFVTNRGAGTVSVIESSSHTVSAGIVVGSRPEGVATDAQFGVCVAKAATTPCP